jgi:hypothetical protein
MNVRHTEKEGGGAMRRFLLVCEALVLTLTVALVACGDKKVGKKETEKEKVDCNRMCARTFKECVGEVLVSSGKMDQKKIDLIKKAGAFKKVQDAGYEACMKDCAKKKGFGADASEINKCLDKKGCKDYAACIKEHIK